VFLQISTGVLSEENDWRGWRYLQHPAGGLYSVHAGHLKIQHHEVGLQIPEHFHSGGTVRCLAADLPSGSRSQNCAERTPNEFVIIDDQEPSSHVNPLAPAKI
jgi:hypothetical protein